jgi:hypothetical protein
MSSTNGSQVINNESRLYDPRFQNLLLAHCLRDSQFLDHVAPDLRPELIGNEYGQRLVRILVDYHEREHSAPNDLVFHLLDDLKQQGLLQESLHNNLCTYIDDLFALGIENRQYLLREFDRFVKHQLFRRNIIPSAELVKAGRFDEAEQLLKETFLHRSSSEQDLGRAYTLDPTRRIRRRLEEDHQRFWWLVRDIDSRVRGLKRGELGVLQSQRSSGGKSAGLVFLTRQFAFQQRNILIYTLEMSEEDYEDRLDMCIGGLAKESLTDYTRLHQKLRKLVFRGGQIWIKQFPSMITTVSDLQRHKETLEALHGFSPDVIVLDYADELGPEKYSRAGNSFEVGKEVYSHLRGWAVKDKIAIWTGMQSGRGAMDVAVADQEHSGESIAKAWIADLIISINRTAKEQEEGLTRLHFVKNRTGVARFTLTVRTDFDTMQFVRQDLREDTT